jgi:hypothetical protein
MFRNSFPVAILVFVVLTLLSAGPARANNYNVGVCQGPAGGPVYDGWFSLPNRTWIGTAEELCLAFGPSVTDVFQLYPDVNGGVPPVAYQYTCPILVPPTPGVCTPLGGSPPAPEPGCTTSSCFCVDDGEGFGAALATPTASFVVDGCYTAFGSGPLGAATSYLVSIAPDAPLTTFNSLGSALGLQSTGLQRGTMTRLACATGALTTIQSGSAAGTTPLVPGEAYRIRNPSGFSYVNPINPAFCACTETAIYDVTGVGNATPYAWWMDDGKNGAYVGGEVFNGLVAGEPVGAPSGQLAQNLVNSINLTFGGAPCTAALVSFNPARISVTCTPCNFDLYVATAQAGAPPWIGQCAVENIGCVYNPLIRKVYTQQDAGDIGESLVIDAGAGGDLALSWGRSCLASDTDYEVYEGTIGDWTSHTSVLCSTGGATSTTLTPQAADSYYLVVPRNPLYEGSYGRDSAGVMRPQGGAACAIQQTVGVCP